MPESPTKSFSGNLLPNEPAVPLEKPFQDPLSLEKKSPDHISPGGEEINIINSIATENTTDSLKKLHLSNSNNNTDDGEYVNGKNINTANCSIIAEPSPQDEEYFDAESPSGSQEEMMSGGNNTLLAARSSSDELELFYEANESPQSTSPEQAGVVSSNNSLNNNNNMSPTAKTKEKKLENLVEKLLVENRTNPIVASPKKIKSTANHFKSTNNSAEKKLIPSVSKVHVLTRGKGDEYITGVFQEYRIFEGQEFLMVHFGDEIGLNRITKKDAIFDLPPRDNNIHSKNTSNVTINTSQDHVTVPKIVVTPPDTPHQKVGKEVVAAASEALPKTTASSTNNTQQQQQSIRNQNNINNQQHNNNFNKKLYSADVDIDDAPKPPPPSPVTNDVGSNIISREQNLNNLNSSGPMMTKPPRRLPQRVEVITAASSCSMPSTGSNQSSQDSRQDRTRQILLAAQKKIQKLQDSEMVDVEGDDIMIAEKNNLFDIDSIKLPAEEGTREVDEVIRKDDDAAYLDYCRMYQGNRCHSHLAPLLGGEGDVVLKSAIKFFHTVMQDAGDQYALHMPEDYYKPEIQEKLAKYQENLEFLKTVAIDVFRTLNHTNAKDENLAKLHASCLHGAALIFDRRILRCVEIGMLQPETGDRAIFLVLWSNVAKAYMKYHNYGNALPAATKCIRMFHATSKIAKKVRCHIAHDGDEVDDDIEDDDDKRIIDQQATTPHFVYNIVFGCHILRAKVAFAKKKPDIGLKELTSAIEIQASAGKLFTHCYKDIGEVCMASSQNFPDHALKFAEVLLFLIHKIEKSNIENFVNQTAIEFVNRFLMNQIFHLLKNGFPEPALSVTRVVRQKFQVGSLWLHQYMLARALLDVRKSRSWSKEEIVEIQETTLELAIRGKNLEVCFIIDDLVFGKTSGSERCDFVQLALECNHIMVKNSVDVSSTEAVNQTGEARKRMILQCQAILIEVLSKEVTWANENIDCDKIAAKALTGLLKNLETIPPQCLQKDELQSLINLVLATCKHCTEVCEYEMAVKLCLTTIPLVRTITPCHAGVMLFKELIDNLVKVDNISEAVNQSRNCQKIFPCAESNFLGAYLHASTNQEFGACQAASEIPTSPEANEITREDLVLLLRCSVDRNLPNLFKTVLELCQEMVMRNNMVFLSVPLVIQHAFELSPSLLIEKPDSRARHPFAKQYTDSEKFIFQIDLMDMYSAHIFPDPEPPQSTITLIDLLHKTAQAHAHLSFMKPSENDPSITQRFGEVYLKFLDCLRIDKDEYLARGFHILLSSRCAMLDKLNLERKIIKTRVANNISDSNAHFEGQDDRNHDQSDPDGSVLVENNQIRYNYNTRQEIISLGKEHAKAYWCHVKKRDPERALHERKIGKPRVCNLQVDCQVALMEIFVLLDEECLRVSRGEEVRVCENRLRVEVDDCVSMLDAMCSEGKMHSLRRRIKECDLFPTLEHDLVDRIFKTVLAKKHIDLPERLIEVWMDTVEQVREQEPGSERLLSTVELILPFSTCTILKKPMTASDDNEQAQSKLFQLPLPTAMRMLEVCLAYGATSLQNQDRDFAVRWLNLADELRTIMSTDDKDELSQKFRMQIDVDLGRLRTAANQQPPKQFPPVPVFPPSLQTSPRNTVLQRSSHVPAVLPSHIVQQNNQVFRSNSCPNGLNQLGQFGAVQILTADSSPRQQQQHQLPPGHPVTLLRPRVSLPPRPPGVPVQRMPNGMMMMPRPVLRRVSGQQQSFSVPSSPTGFAQQIPVRPLRQLSPAQQQQPHPRLPQPQNVVWTPTKNTV